MKIAHLYTGDDGKSHFGEIEFPLGPGPHGSVSEMVAAKGVIFRETDAGYDLDFHTAPRKQFVINLDASVEITIGDGTKRVFGPGEVFLADDTTGQGHISRAVDGKVRHSIFVPLE